MRGLVVKRGSDSSRSLRKQVSTQDPCRASFYGHASFNAHMPDFRSQEARQDLHDGYNGLHVCRLSSSSVFLFFWSVEHGNRYCEEI